jgi:hypothetical protein
MTLPVYLWVVLVLGAGAANLAAVAFRRAVNSKDVDLDWVPLRVTR